MELLTRPFPALSRSGNATGGGRSIGERTDLVSGHLELAAQSLYVQQSALSRSFSQQEELGGLGVGHRLRLDAARVLDLLPWFGAP